MAPVFCLDDPNSGGDVVSFNRAEDGWFARLRLGAIGSGANLAVRRSAFARHGLFRESLGRGAPIGGDENYCLLTLVENGETVIYQPSAYVYHPKQAVERIRDLERSSIAYILYVMATKPQLRWLLIKDVMRRLRGQPATGRAGQQSRGGHVCRAVIGAPALLLAALRIDGIARQELGADGPSSSVLSRGELLSVGASPPTPEDAMQQISTVTPFGQGIAH